MRDQIDGITLIEDFAHHPTAIRETLRALRAVYPQARLWAVLEPRSNTLRRKVLAPSSIASLASRRSRRPRRRLPAGAHSRSRAACIPKRSSAPSTTAGTPAELHPNADSIVAALAPQLASGDVVAILSNGGFDGIYLKLPARLRELHPGAAGA